MVKGMCVCGTNNRNEVFMAWPFLKVRMSHTQTHIQRNDNWLFIHLHLSCLHTNPSLMVVVLMALFSRRRDTTSRDVPSICHNSSIFFFPTAFLFLLGLLSSWSSTAWPPPSSALFIVFTDFISTLSYAQSVTASIFHSTLVCLHYTWIKVLRCGICWPSFWSKEPAVYSHRFSGIIGTALLVCNKFSTCGLWINSIVISLCVCHIQTGVKGWNSGKFTPFVFQWVHHLVAEFAEWDVFNIAPTNQWSSRYSLSMWNQGATKHHSQSTYTGVFWGGCVCLHSCWLRSSLFAMLFRNNQWSDSR